MSSDHDDKLLVFSTHGRKLVIRAREFAAMQDNSDDPADGAAVWAECADLPFKVDQTVDQFLELMATGIWGEPALPRSVTDPESTPPDDAEVQPCGVHGGPFVRVETKHDDNGNPTGTFQVFECGCLVPL